MLITDVLNNTVMEYMYSHKTFVYLFLMYANKTYTIIADSECFTYLSHHMKNYEVTPASEGGEYGAIRLYREMVD